MRWVIAIIIALIVVLGLTGQIIISPVPGKKNPVNIGETPPFTSVDTGPAAPAGNAITTEAGDPIQTEGGDDIITE